MKRGQLAAVIIIVLLVAAVGAFYVFSDKRAGQASRTLAAAKFGTQPTYPTGQQPSQQYYPPSSSPQPASTISSGVQQPPPVMADIPPLGWGSSQDVEKVLSDKFESDLLGEFASMLKKLALDEYARCSKVCYVPYYDCCKNKEAQYLECMKATAGSYRACLYGCDVTAISSCSALCKEKQVNGCKNELTVFCDKEGAYDNWLKCIKDNKCDVIKNVGFSPAEFRPNCADLK